MFKLTNKAKNAKVTSSIKQDRAVTLLPLPDRCQRAQIEAASPFSDGSNSHSNPFINAQQLVDVNACVNRVRQGKGGAEHGREVYSR